MLMLVKADFFASFIMGIVVEKVVTLGLGQALEFRTNIRIRLCGRGFEKLKAVMDPGMN